ncbi:MAG: heavy metal-responsive transcriptional regulator [Cyanobacteria bacterium P01_H01_bin.58]
MAKIEADLLRIGQVSTQSNLPVKTIRFYEDRGLIQAAQRTTGGFRMFYPSVLTRLSFIRRSQALGLSLNDIQDILNISDSGERPCQKVRHKFQSKIVEIEKRIIELKNLKTQLRALMAEADAKEKLDAHICPIIEHANDP